jgi:hypothetical protein
MASRSGGIGLRVSGRRSSATAIKRASGTPRQDDVKNFLSDSAPVLEAKGSPVSGSSLVTSENWVKVVEPEMTELSQPQPNGHPQAEMTAEAPAKVVQFIPQFKGAAEMEERRKMRMLARRGPAGLDIPQPPVNTLNLELSSSSSEDEPMLDEDEDSDEVVGGNDSDDDEFDP